MMEIEHKPVKHTFIVTIDEATAAYSKNDEISLLVIRSILDMHGMKAKDAVIRRDGLYYKKEFLF